MSFHSSNTTVGSRPPSPQRDTPPSPTSRSADAPYASVISGRMPQRDWEKGTVGNTHGHAIIIDIFPDDVFLRVFDYCSTDENPYNWWHALVHVCRRWRQLIFTSPRRLNLQLLCTRRTPVRKNLSFWPTLPITISYSSWIDPKEEDNIFAALEYPNRVRNFKLELSRLQVQNVVMAMQVPFPTLSHLQISISHLFGGGSPTSTIPTLPDGFLGGNASSLQEISITGISFPALSAFLMSATNLIYLRLGGRSNFSAPVTLVTSLAATTRLEDLIIENDFATVSRSRRRAILPSRVVLPALTQIRFRGNYTYLENLVAQIDCPRLRHIGVLYDDEVLHSSQLFQFIGRSEDVKLAPFRLGRARVDFHQMTIDLDGSRVGPHPSHVKLELTGQAYRVTVTRQFLLPASAMLTTVHHLSVRHNEHGLYDREIADWIGFFSLFPAVETLHLGGKLPTTLDSVLNEPAVAGVLPALRFLYLDGPPTKSVSQFISARQVSDCPVTLVKTQEEFKMHEACCETEGVVDKHAV